MMENTVFKYVLVLPAVLGLIAVWIVVGSVGAKIAGKHAETRLRSKCPNCEAKLKAGRQGLRNRLLAAIFLVDIARYVCQECGFRRSVWKA